MILFFIKVLYLCKQKLKPKTMTRIILFTMIFLLGLSSAQAQNKSERIKEIRKMYAEAKAQIANNGKDGNPAKDMKIAFNEIVSIEHDIYNEGSLDIYFDEQRKVNVSDGSFNAYEQPYFISYYNTIHGHECFREQMFDRKTGVLAFAFVRWITTITMPQGNSSRRRTAPRVTIGEQVTQRRNSPSCITRFSSWQSKTQRQLLP